MSEEPTPVIYWFRQDLRLDDLPALHAAVESGAPVIPCFIIDEDAPQKWAPGNASRWWLRGSLGALAKAIEKRQGTLLVRSGCSEDVLSELIEETGAYAVYCSQAYEPWNRELEERLGARLGRLGVALHCLPGSLIFTPGDVLNRAGLPFKVFTPFWRHCRSQLPESRLLPAPGVGAFAAQVPTGQDPEAWPLASSSLQPVEDWGERWTPGADGALSALDRFLNEALSGYREDRDIPAVAGTSRLSPHLHWGEISPRHVAQVLRTDAPGDTEDDQEKFLAELGWREFNQHLLFHFPHIDEQPFKDDFKSMPWRPDADAFEAWKAGLTGYPIVDAGMRELRATGFMHNRVRMICASFLTKHLLVPWQWGARWFWETLVDADLANNSGGWQWVAGCGADASPWFRIFNPVLQGKKFDPEGAYVRHWVPELAALPDRSLHAPWELAPLLLAEADVVLGETYPHPLVDHATARAQALEAYHDRSSAPQAPPT
ncbi:cryptochrome/photolyase family protein [Pseudohalioglobus lutimaris]|uniref:Deoxyribodipyrimidine photo-lyase n=1 Tax=Pseudohalioglobus lutimaris TaxID=1737061 RepID=A0A2N5X494_9GAMM|nr:deoxyribodipyrimidine photo-lyase [Pseudohalioglobus lutimaris]PLW69316.1 deoxyribodipyrimidine photolyase [Pseudohalioglobus lutimaris]